ncbi:MAG: hypothetical protein COA94_08150 [Rickettsiales bacterium]|nr:MAG: hypothetical protein COA94_08150 [Rickettsiales bacterium]
MQREGDEDIPEYSFKAVFREGDRIDLQAQITRSTITTNMRMTQGFHQMSHALCEVQRATRANKLIAILGTNNEYALFDLHGKGSKVISAGTSAYVAKCVPVEATRADYAECTEEVPVKIGNKTFFADAVNWIIRELPTVIPCSEVMPMRWFINDRWLCSTPTTQLCAAPSRLNVSSFELTNNNDYAIQLGRGLFTHAQLQQHRRFMANLESRRAAIAHVTLAAIFHADDSGALGIPISKEALKKLKHDIASSYFPMIAWLGWSYSYIYGAIAIVVALSVVAGALSRAFILYRERGCGWWIFGAVSAAVFSIIRFQFQIVRTTRDLVVNNLDTTVNTTAYQEIRTENAAFRKDIERLALQVDTLTHTQETSHKLYPSPVLPPQDFHKPSD